MPGRWLKVVETVRGLREAPLAELGTRLEVNKHLWLRFAVGAGQSFDLCTLI